MIGRPGLAPISRRYVLIIYGLICLGIAVFTINKINSWWIDLIVGVFVLFALISFETGFFTSEKEIRELTEEGPISKDTKEKLVDRF